eukprot:6466138-Amphidinium_carterae.1
MADVGETALLRSVPPYTFLRLLSEREEERSSGLAALKRTWKTLNKLEKAGSKDAEQFRASLEWPLNVWTREILVDLYETEFASVPAHVNEAAARRTKTP